MDPGGRGGVPQEASLARTHSFVYRPAVEAIREFEVQTTLQRRPRPQLRLVRRRGFQVRHQRGAR